jgi:hypothetical protein
MSDLDVVKQSLAKLSTDLASDHELERMITAGHFNHLLPVRHARVIHEQDSERFQLKQEIEKLKRERGQLLAELASQDQKLREMTEQLTRMRQGSRARIRRQKTSQHGELYQLAVMIAQILSKMNEPKGK